MLIFMIKFNLKVQISWMPGLATRVNRQPPEKIHESHVERARLLHGPESLSLHSLHILSYLDHFTVLTVSQSQPFARIWIKAAEGISVFNVVLDQNDQITGFLLNITFVLELQWHLSNMMNWWLWFKECDSYFSKITKFPKEKINERSFSKPHPKMATILQTTFSKACF